ncbi:hypothetical protein CPC08DRAFT_769525 [Agrocybe pediades]|nr:hypothetical protein CPC08DRAFT_769525 [Agrocybe pediades]
MATISTDIKVVVFSLMRYRDILWNIFNVVASEKYRDFEQRLPVPSSLKIITRASQVCGIWRDILLFLPSIWGRCLDFDELTNQSWRSEVIRRTGDAPLYIQRYSGKGHHWSYASRVHEEEEQFIGCFISENWYRVRSLKLDVSLYMLQTPFRTLQSKPAPLLQCLELWDLIGGAQQVEMALYRKRFLNRHRFLMFDGHAPQLRRLRVSGFSESRMYLVSKESSWLASLRCLNLDACYTIEKFLVPSVRLTTVISPPSLRILKIDFHDGVEFLVRFKSIPANCELYFWACGLEEQADVEGHVRDLRLLESQEGRRRPTSLSISAQPESLVVSFPGFYVDLGGDYDFPEFRIPDITPLIEPFADRHANPWNLTLDRSSTRNGNVHA